MIRRIKVVFTRELNLPRFTMKKGAEWEVRPDKLTENGFNLGGGFVWNSDYDAVSVVRKK